MKRVFYLSFALVVGLLLASCGKDESVKYLNADITIDESAIASYPSPDSYTVTFTNVATGYTRTKQSVGTLVSADSLITGVYNIVAQAQYSVGGYAYNYIGTANNVTVDATGVSASIRISASKEAALVLKEIYQSCTRTSANAVYFKDQFYEIYNNSDQIVYADGICIGEVMSASTYLWKENGVSAAGLEGDADDYIFFNKLIWQVPGSGKDYPIAPGESFIIAQYAMNHTTVNDNSVLDLSTAEFETFIDHYAEKSGQVDCNAKNMILVSQATAPTNQWNTPVTGWAMAIFYPSRPVKDTDYISPVNYPASKGREVLKSDIIDAVEVIQNATRAKALEDVFDAGRVYCSGSYSGESVSRKIKETKEDGRIVYQDTNNSTEDFVVNSTPEIRRNGAKRPSWSTWTTAQ